MKKISVFLRTFTLFLLFFMTVIGISQYSFAAGDDEFDPSNCPVSGVADNCYSDNSCPIGQKCDVLSGCCYEAEEEPETCTCPDSHPNGGCTGADFDTCYTTCSEPCMENGLDIEACNSTAGDGGFSGDCSDERFYNTNYSCPGQLFHDKSSCSTLPSCKCPFYGDKTVEDCPAGWTDGGDTYNLLTCEGGPEDCCYNDCESYESGGYRYTADRVHYPVQCQYGATCITSCSSMPNRNEQGRTDEYDTTSCPAKTGSDGCTVTCTTNKTSDCPTGYDCEYDTDYTYSGTNDWTQSCSQPITREKILTCSSNYTSGCASANETCSGCASTTTSYTTWVNNGSATYGNKEYDGCVANTSGTLWCPLSDKTCITSCTEVDSDETDEQTVDVSGPNKTDSETTSCSETYYRDCVPGTCKDGYDCTWADEQSSCTAPGTKTRSRTAFQTCSQDQQRDCTGKFTSSGCSSADDECSGCSAWGEWSNVGEKYSCSITRYGDWGNWGSCDHTPCTPTQKTCTKTSETCTTLCTEVSSTATTTKTETCSLTGCTIANGTCTYSGCTEDNVYQCSTNFTGGSGNACSSGGDTCSGCKNNDYSTYKSTSRSCGNCAKVITCNPGYWLNGSTCEACPDGSWCANNVKNSCPSGASGSDGGRNEKEDCYKTCNPKTIDNGTTTVVNAKEYYNGSAYPACTYNVNCNPKYGASGNKTSNPACTLCDTGEFSAGGTATCSSCPDDFDDGAAVTKQSECYKNCSKSCTQQAVPTGADSVTHGTTSKSGVHYYGKTCDAPASTCSLTINSCKANYWLESGTCNACDNGYSSSAGSTSKSQCTKSCSVECKQNACSTQDANAAACSYGSNTATGTQSQDGECDAVQNACPITITKCNANHWLENGECNACDAGYTSPAGSTSKSQCTKSCSVECKQNACSTQDANAATCSYGANDATGTQSQGGTCDATQKACPITVTKCNANYLLKNGACTSCPEHATCDGTGDWVCDSNYKKTTTGCVLDIFTCTQGKTSAGKTCPAGHYCPGGTVDAGTEATSCSPQCPKDTSGGTVSSATGATTIGACVTVRKNVELEDKTGSGDQTCYYNDSRQTYSNTCTIKITSCVAGRYREQDASITCRLTDIGQYSPSGDIAAYSCSALDGADTTVRTAGTGSDAATDCYNTCSSIPISDGERVPVNATESYNGTKIPACTYTTTCNTGYKASGTTCVPKVLTITLNHNGAETAPASTIYLKYNTGWYSDSDASRGITSISKPTIAGETFGGYLSSSNDVVVDATGMLTTNYKVFSTNATITASWTENDPISCAAGTYYKGTGASCTDCPADSYCEGVNTVQDIGTEKGRKTCASLNGTYTAATGKTVTISSAAKSKAASDCFATNVAYKSSTNRATGTQTCYYATGKYESACTNKTVLACIAGYYLKNTSDTDCTAAGVGYYSATDALKRSACPNLGDNVGVTTASDTSAKVTECYRGNIWYTANKSGYRRSCYHHSDASDTNVDTGYSYNCAIPTLVACEGGYYDDGNTVDGDGYRVCVAVGKDFWSPGITSGQEPEVHNNNPTTQRNQCPDGTSTESVTTASSESQCIGQLTACVAGKSYADKTHTTCAVPYYCPGGGDVLVNGSGCRETCPAGSITSGNGETRATGESSVNKCFKTFTETDGSGKDLEHGTAKWDCSWKGTAEQGEYSDCYVTVLTCDAGYYNPTDSKACEDVTSGYYSPKDALGRSECPKKTNYTVGSDSKAAINTQCYIACSSYLPTVPNSTAVMVKGDAKKYYTGTAYAACEYTAKCQTGYRAVEGVNPACEPVVVEITLDDTDGTGGSGTIYQKYANGWYSNSGATTVLGKVKVPTSASRLFQGYYTTKTGGEKVIDVDGTVLVANTAYTANTTLYAHWNWDMVSCESGKYFNNGTLTTCAVPYYCDGDGEVVAGTTGCRMECPQNGYTEETGAATVEKCIKRFTDADGEQYDLANGTSEWTCSWKGTVTQGSYAGCDVSVLTCDAGYYNPVDSTVCEPVVTGYFSPDKSLKQVACPGLGQSEYTIGSNSRAAANTDCYIACSSYSPAVDNATKVAFQGNANKYYTGTDYAACEYAVECETGYSPVNGTSPRCNPKSYTVTLDKNGGSGNVAESVQCTFDSGACALPDNSGLTKSGYKVVAKWCTNADGTGVCFDAGSTVATNISANATDTTLYAVWTPGVFKITLSAPDA
ncbi:MAG: hypothetical protein IKW57_00485, partial [Alphaproteobacteria bacterium]|nr:hypothetical protein [Alphaproteobacteria bacterium]